ncbi:hypothetical protein LS48_03055 [Aequorivita aquimaris]|uniref:DUF4468 domain-containing protein n=1 Tax=Aequorivita aquimaris TaxID=1548749 RepID=A0A137RJQ5_9FLAO|nr:hypothetical protein [Aequorivita aquimaris]KXO00410.1 hypothetical protein LS48_03055 [Aequorivita aquimaris]
MKQIYFIILVFSISKMFGQDIILTNENEMIRAKITKITNDIVQYNRYDNLEGPIYELPISLLRKIDFENGTTQNFEIKHMEMITSKVPKFSLAETKDFIIKTINEHGFEEDTFKRKYRASFEGDFLRLKVMKKDESKPVNDGILFDFSNVYKFQNISKRSDKLAFLNIWVSIVKDEKKMKFDKHKLIMRIDDPNKAESILNALKYYNSLLLGKSKSDDKF